MVHGLCENEASSQIKTSGTETKMEYNDFIELATFINMWDLADKEHQERSRTEFRQFMVAMVDKGPEHLIGIWRLYLKTRQLDDKEMCGFEK